MTLNDRVAWALNWIKNKHNLNNIQLADKLDIDKNTAQAYCHGKGNLKGSALAIIVKDYGFNGHWLMTGAGEPFPGAREIFPEMCGEPGITEAQRKSIADYVRNHPAATLDLKSSSFSDQKINIEEAIGKAYKILSTGNDLSQELYIIIKQLSIAMETGQPCQLYSVEMKNMQDQINDLKEKINQLSNPTKD